MKRVKEFTIKLLEDNKTPIVEIDGQKLSGITNLMVKYNSDDVVDNPFDNGFRVEYLIEENGRYCKQTIGQSFRIDR